MKKHVWTALLLLCAAVLIGVGIGLDQPGEVLTKATHVCLECIGIG